MNRDYVLSGLYERIQTMTNRYYMYCNGVNDWGLQLTNDSAKQGRTKCKRDLAILALVEELANNIPEDFTLSDEAAKGFEFLVEPNEKHRRKY